ncbi:hypothetical protein [Thermoflavifilum thermophilum]|uniref:Oxygen tolerance n=1 Tax=Thermoflavifilum thermophilum TaxID=1393122 RepID=A0A1I7N8G1_9BACT|nr:hypothetical protein [Thermoflavifilum thermophilum]SFV30960.1 hypothetical protein SAMN05660895_0939 [Thermoflavifilum thermophilum]
MAFLGIMWHMQAFGQQPRVEVHTDSSQILIGSQFHLYLDITLPGSYRLQGYALPDSFNHIEVVQRGQADTISTGGQWQYHQVLTLTSFDSGRWQIPSFPVVLASSRLNDTTHLMLQTDSLWIQVQTVPVDTTKPFMPIKDIRRVKLTWLDVLPYVLLGIALVLLVLGIIYVLRHRKRKAAPVVIQQPLQPPYEEAMALLKQWQAEQPWTKIQMKEYFTRLTDVLRRYVERAFQIPAMEITSGELLEQMDKHRVLREHRAVWEEILSEADRVKFAKWQSSPEIAALCLEKAIQVVEATHQAQEAERRAAESASAADAQAAAVKNISK